MKINFTILCFILLAMGCAITTAYPVTEAAPGTAKKPDLVITDVTASPSAALEGQVTLSAMVKNVGGIYSSHFSTYFYLSKDTIIDASDSYLDRIDIISLAPESVLTISCSVTVSSESSGDYYIIAKADASDAIDEQNEINNIRYSNKITIEPAVPTQRAVSYTAPISPSLSGTPSVPTTITSLKTLAETYGAESNPTGNPLGGGIGYQDVYTAHDPRVTAVVTSKAKFLRALAGAKAGDVIYIPEKVSINLSGVYPTRIPAGVTIASNRGVNGSRGGKIFQERLPHEPGIKSMLYIYGDGVRITGLRLEGPDKKTVRLSTLGLSVRDGIRVYEQDNLEVDNCEIWGWSNGGVDFILLNGGYGYVHHNYFHHIQTEGRGYAVVQYGGRILVEGNTFDYVKNPVAGGGLVGEGYEARFNLVNHTTSKSHSFDIHPYTNPTTGEVIAGSSYKIHHNTVKETTNYAVLLSGVPLEGVWIDHNKFQWRTYPDGRPYPIPGPVIQNIGVGRVYMTNNLIGTPEVLYKKGPIYYINDR